MKKFAWIVAGLMWTAGSMGTAGALIANSEDTYRRSPCSFGLTECVVFLAAVSVWPATIAGRAAYRIVRAEPKP